MIKNVILEFLDGATESCDDLFEYSGDKNFSECVSLEAKVDTTELSLSFLGETFPNLQKLRLNNSIIPSIRDIGCTLKQLKFLSLARCNITCLDGISTLSEGIEELYLAYNNISDLTDLMSMNNLKILDLEENKIDKIENIEILGLCPSLVALTLAGNSCSDREDYRETVSKLLPSLIYLDEKKLKKPKPPKIPASPRTPPPPTEPTSPKAKISPKKLQFDEIIMTEQIIDEVDDRPPTSRGVKGFDIKQPTRHSKAFGSSPRIVRPCSARGHKPQ